MNPQIPQIYADDRQRESLMTDVSQIAVDIRAKEAARVCSEICVNLRNLRIPSSS